MSLALSISHYHDLAMEQVTEERRSRISTDLTHEELVADALLQILEERYRELTKEEKDAVIMMLLENSSDLT